MFLYYRSFHNFIILQCSPCLFVHSTYCILLVGPYLCAYSLYHIQYVNKYFNAASTGSHQSLVEGMPYEV